MISDVLELVVCQVFDINLDFLLTQSKRQNFFHSLLTLDLGSDSFLSESSTSMFSMPESTSTPDELLHCFSQLSSTSIATSAKSWELLEVPGVMDFSGGDRSPGEAGLLGVLAEAVEGVVVGKSAKRASRLRLICK